MAARHEAALQCMEPDITFKEMAYALVLACEECEEDGSDLHSDSAVILITARLAFMTNSEMLSPDKIFQLIELCKRGCNASIVPAPETFS